MIDGKEQDRIAAAADRTRPACPLDGTTLRANPLSYAVHGTQGYRAKCPTCGVRLVMAWAPLGRALAVLFGMEDHG